MENAVKQSFLMGHERGYREGWNDGYDVGQGNGPGHMYDNFEDWVKHQPDIHNYADKGLPT